MSVILRFGIFLPLSLLTIWQLSRNPRPVVREGLVALTGFAGALPFIAVANVSLRPFAEVVLYMTTLNIIFLATIQKLRFSYLVAVCVCIILAAWLGDVTRSEARMPMGMVPNFITFVAILCCFAGFFLERDSRRAFLLDLLTRLYASQLRDVAIRDALTDLGNRHAFDAHSSSIVERSSSPLLVGAIMVDIDYFKKFNDAFGHEAGDRCLQQVAETLSLAMRPIDRVFRFGGEEFLVILEGADIDNTASVAQRLRELIQAKAIPHVAPSPGSIVTASFGCASAEIGSLSDLAYLVAVADAALYEGKASGRNCVAVDNTLVSSS